MLTPEMLVSSPRATESTWTPLAERMRPRTLAEFVGQRHLLEPGRLLHSVLEQKRLVSLLLWGPPGTGKTTLARLYADSVGASFQALSAVSAGVKEIRETVEGARLRGLQENRPTVLFVDEIHRFNKTQQDGLLPWVETGVVTLVGATTENPGFEVTNALRSRCRVLALQPLTEDDLAQLAQRALVDAERGLGPTAPTLPPDAESTLVRGCNGDARHLLNTLEIAASLAASAAPSGECGVITPELVAEAQQKRLILYDRNGDQHYQLASAFIKSMRGSDPDAALYYMTRMLEGGEDPIFLLRRMVIFASEDIGNADPHALPLVMAALQAFQLVGMPEGALAMTQACTYLATAPKSNAVISAYGKARKAVLAHPGLEIPPELVNAANAVMRQMGFGRGYRYPHHFEGHYVPARYLPDRIRDHMYYEPSNQGYEQQIAQRLQEWRRRASS
jgi:putative ATPase